MLKRFNFKNSYYCSASAMFAELAGLTTPNRLAMSHGHLEADALMWRSPW
jgi:hypothetical protein